MTRALGLPRWLNATGSPWLIPAIALLFFAACGDKPPPPTPAAAPAPSVRGPIVPCATCKVITVKMITDDVGNYFEPKSIEAHEGDVIRFTLQTGVHNVHFLPDSNPGRTNLPTASDLLQLPGQTHDVLLDFGAGRFYFQCDPHAALGMMGHVKVEQKD
jgi:plastocyanin